MIKKCIYYLISFIIASLICWYYIGALTLFVVGTYILLLAIGCIFGHIL